MKNGKFASINRKWMLLTYSEASPHLTSYAPLVWYVRCYSPPPGPSLLFPPVSPSLYHGRFPSPSPSSFSPSPARSSFPCPSPSLPSPPFLDSPCPYPPPSHSSSYPYFLSPSSSPSLSPASSPFPTTHCLSFSFFSFSLSPLFFPLPTSDGRQLRNHIRSISCLDLK